MTNAMKTPAETSCLRCGYSYPLSNGEILNCESGTERDGGDVKPGVVFPCINCLTLFIFNDDMELRAATIEEVKNILSAKAFIEKLAVVFSGGDGNKLKDGFFLEVGKISFLFHAWLLANPNSEFSVTYKYPPEIGIIATMVDGLSSGIIEPNEDAVKAIKDLGWDTDGSTCPTVTMFRIATELEPLRKS